MTKNEIHPGWQQTQNDEYLALVKSRLEKVNLTWVDQVIGLLIEGHTFRDENIQVKDIGCQAFQFYKQIKQRGLKWYYFGYELEQTYLDIGLRHFPELEKSYCVGDFTAQESPRETDVSITSATLEHVDNWVAFLEKMLQSTRTMAVIRTFLGEKTERISVRALHATQDYPIWQFGFKDLLDVVAKLGFSPRVIRDDYTGSLPVYKAYGTEKLGVVRTQYVIVCIRNGQT